VTCAVSSELRSRQAVPTGAIDCPVDLGAGARSGPARQAMPHRDLTARSPARGRFGRLVT
jgi:hypothetical protein